MVQERFRTVLLQIRKRLLSTKRGAKRDLDGATRLNFIIGDPIAHVKSPSGVTDMLRARGRNSICIPGHVAMEDLETFWRGMLTLKNLDRIIITLPHRLAAFSIAM
ncbi:hypothetical protein [Neorhizobium sp. DT-125]|uniref:hypothetical protein n=1 Tax=Neorhizobium sp. DT-125 TaxID=3396163 RepID=UPI003F1C4EA0